MASPTRSHRTSSLIQTSTTKDKTCRPNRGRSRWLATAGLGIALGRHCARPRSGGADMEGIVPTLAGPGRGQCDARDRVHAKGITRSAGAGARKRSRQTSAAPLWDAIPIPGLQSRTWPSQDYRSWPQGRRTPSAKVIARRWLSASGCITTAEPGRTSSSAAPSETAAAVGGCRNIGAV